MDIVDGLYTEKGTSDKYVWKNNSLGSYLSYIYRLHGEEYFLGLWEFLDQDSGLCSKLLLPKQFLISTEENEE